MSYSMTFTLIIADERFRMNTKRPFGIALGSFIFKILVYCNVCDFDEF